MLSILDKNEMEPDSADLILQAFRTLDIENLGYITADYFESLMTSKGAPFRR